MEHSKCFVFYVITTKTVWGYGTPCVFYYCFIFLLSSVGNGVHPGSFTSPCASNHNFFTPLPHVNPCSIAPWIELQSSSPSCQATARESDWLGPSHLASDWLRGHRSCVCIYGINQEQTGDAGNKDESLGFALRNIINYISCAFMITDRQILSRRPCRDSGNKRMIETQTASLCTC